MTERAESEAYWQDDLSLGEIELLSERYPLRMRLHRTRESYQERRELVPLEVSSGERIYLHGTPYLLIPEVQLTADVDVASREITSNGSGFNTSSDRAIGEVAAAGTGRSQAREVGNCQGWCYPSERLIVHWETYAFDWCRTEDPLTDLLLDRLWRRFEELLVETLPEAERIVTLALEPQYPREQWRAFLVQQGYGPLSAQAYSKTLS